jgi:flagellar basal body-associated protein FliL
MALAGTLLLVIIGVAILMMLAGVMVIMKMFR